MYIRFAQLGRDRHCRVAPGLFHAAHRLPRYDASDWRHAEINRQFGWFNRNLEVPETLGIRAGRHGNRRGVCWFVPDAADHVAEARYLAWLLGEIGIPIRELRSPRPGTLIWSDPYQIVALPERSARVTVH